MDGKLTFLAVLAIAAALVLAMWGGYTLYKIHWSGELPTEQESNEPHSQKETAGIGAKSASSEFSDALQTKTENAKIGKNARKWPWNIHWPKGPADPNFFIALFTFALVVVAFWQWGSVSRQADLMGDTLDQMTSDSIRQNQQFERQYDQFNAQLSIGTFNAARLIDLYLERVTLDCIPIRMAKSFSG